MVFSKTWFETHQRKLLFLLNNSLTKRWFRWCLRIDCKDKIVNITPNSYTIFLRKMGKKVELKTDFRTHDKYAKRMYYAFKPVWWTIHFIDWVVLDRFELPSFWFDTLTVYPAASSGGTTVDGNVERTGTNETFATIIAWAWTGADVSGTDDDVAFVRAHTTSNRFQRVARGIYTFDTSPLTASAVISATVFGSYGWDLVVQLGAFEVDVVGSTPASNNTLVNADYGQLGSTVFSSIASGSLNAVNGGWGGGYNNFTLDANGIANVSLTGISKFWTRLNWDTDNSFGGTWSSNKSSYYNSYLADQTGTSNDPKLTITYTLPIANNNFLLMF